MRNKYLIVFVLFALISSCTDKFEDFNIDQKNPKAVAGEMLFSNAQKTISDQLSSTNVNVNVFKLWSQYWTEVQYTDESRYDIAKRSQADWKFRVYYREILQDLKEAEEIISMVVPLTDEEGFENANKIQIIEILNVFTYQSLVDIFGMVPYTEALNIDNLYPKYDDGLTIYRDLIVRLDAAVGALDIAHGSFSASEDFYYQGNVTAWIKFANTLKVKLAINLSDVDAATANATITSALTGIGVFTSSADNALMGYRSAVPNTNPLYVDLVASGRDDFVPANTFVDALNKKLDPRMFSYFANPVLFPYKTDVITGAKVDTTFVDNLVLIYKDMNGEDSIVYKTAPFTILAVDSLDGTRVFNGGKYGYSNSFLSYSHINETFLNAEFEGVLMTYTELMFYFAEAAERGFGVPLSAEAYYNAGITASFAYWGENASSYLLNPDVAYTTASGTWKEKICIQSWIASYTRGGLAYNTFRRLDGITFNIPKSPKTSDGLPPRRYTFPLQEQALNKSSYENASTALGGEGDMLETKIFWDLY